MATGPGWPRVQVASKGVGTPQATAGLESFWSPLLSPVFSPANGGDGHPISQAAAGNVLGTYFANRSLLLLLLQFPLCMALGSSPCPAEPCVPICKARQEPPVQPRPLPVCLGHLASTWASSPRTTIHDSMGGGL